jgi:hypothetical protein
LPNLFHYYYPSQLRYRQTNLGSIRQRQFLRRLRRLRTPMQYQMMDRQQVG